MLRSWITVLRAPAAVHPPNLILVTLDGRRIGAKRVNQARRINRP